MRSRRLNKVPSSDLNKVYDDSRNKLCETVFKAICLSQATAGRYVELKRGKASILFTRLCVSGTSLLRISPENKSPLENWDWAAVASLARGILECYLTFYYLTVEEVDEDEWFTRLNLMHLHDCTARIEMFSHLKNIGSENVDKDLSGFQEQRVELIQRISGRRHFNTFPGKQQKHFLKGKSAFLLSQDEILERMDEDVKAFRFFYHFLSLQTHTFPASFYRVEEHGHGRGVENDKEKSYIAMTLEYINGMFERAVQDMVTLFPDTEKEYGPLAEPPVSFSKK